MADSVQSEIAPVRKTPLTQARLKELLHYDPATGIWTRIANCRRTDRIGRRVGWSDKRGRLFISVDCQEYQAHRLAYFYMKGEWPERILDHRDCDPSTNAWNNLRPATQSQNVANTRKRAGTTSRFKGVVFDKSRGKWIAQITHQYRHYFIGRFDSEEAAHAAYFERAKELFGEFARSA